jgi:hypothetical protein
MLSLGLYAPAWMRAEFPDMPAVGNFEAELFDPLKWKNNYPNPAFRNLLPDDGYWAAKKVMAFTDDQIRAIVNTGEYSDPAAAGHVARTLIERRDKIGRAYFAQVLPLDNFRVEDGRLRFDDLEVVYGLNQPRTFSFSWSVFDNRTGIKTALPEAAAPDLPRSEAQYLAAGIHAGDASKTVTVYLRNTNGSAEVVGVDRTW